MIQLQKRTFFLIFISVLLWGVFISPSFSLASWPLEKTFFVDADYDFNSRQQIEAQLIKTTNQLYFYVDKTWYQTFNDKNLLDTKLYNLASDFEYKIYPFLTNLLGSEDNPGIDNDSRIVIVLEPLKDNYGGYVQEKDMYAKTQYQDSNEGQIIYLNSNLILKAPLNFLEYELAHEFTHLITLKQKPHSQTWFYELMSEFAGQAIGVDTSQVTKQRAQSLLYSNEINLQNWFNSEKDYGKVYLLALYLKEQFGPEIFKEALQDSSSDGFLSFDHALKKRGLSFDEVYFRWLVTNLYNSCDQFNGLYCYKDPNLKGYSSVAYSYYLPMQVKSLLSVTDSIKALTGKYQKINGGLGNVQIKFTLPENLSFLKIAYLIENNQKQKTLGFLDLSSTNTQTVFVNKMGEENIAFYFVSYLGSSALPHQAYFYSFEAQNLGDNVQNEKVIIEKLQQQIQVLKRQLAQLQMQIALQKTYQMNSSCSLFTNDLFYGMKSNEVKCLQQFLANLGNEIYPEKLITGYYGPLTMAAVKRYQAMKNIIQTGYFGPLTRFKVNQELMN